MIAAFKKLDDSEQELMLRAPLLATILIAGADGTIDNKEMRGAIALSKKKYKKVKGQLVEFYRMISEDFEDKLKIVMQGLPHEVHDRNHAIAEELGKLNQIWPKLEKSFAVDYYTSLKYIASEIAESSGGLLGIKSVGEEEERYVDLPMIKAPA